MKKAIYKVSVLNWNKHNPNRKKSYKYTMISNNFCSDHKISVLPTTCKWLFLGILLMCGESNNDTVMITERQVNDLLMSKLGAANALGLLQSLQLLTFELVQTSLNRMNRIELKERNRKERNSSEVKKPRLVEPEISDSFFKDPPKQKSDPDANREVKTAYSKAYYARYKIEPITRSAKFNSAISAIVSRVGKEEAVEIVKFYLTHNDGFYVRNTHGIGLCLRDCETLRTQMLKGKAITSNDIRNFEKNQKQADLLSVIERGEI